MSTICQNCDTTVDVFYPDQNGYVRKCKVHGHDVSGRVARLVTAVGCSFHVCEKERKCRICGCTENKACIGTDGPCWWVEYDLCSHCVIAGITGGYG